MAQISYNTRKFSAPGYTRWSVAFASACALFMLAGQATLTQTVFAQGLVSPDAIVQDVSGVGTDAPPWIVAMAQDPQSPEMRKLAAQNKVRVEFEKQVRQIRFKYFRAEKAEIVQEGMAELRALVMPRNAEGIEVANSASFPVLLDVFERDRSAIQEQIFDIIRDTQTDEGDVTLAWAAVMHKDAAMRSAALTRLKARAEARKAKVDTSARASDADTNTIATATQTGTQDGTIKRLDYPRGVAAVVQGGLRTRREHTMAAAAQVASVLGMFEAIPWLIAGQVSGGAGFGGGGAGTERAGDLAWILVGTQRTFIADLTPVVGDSAVGFDPTLGVITSGTILRVQDAAVYAYSFDVHGSLLSLADSATGTQTASMGFDTPKWLAWYDANKDVIAEKAEGRKH